MEAVEWYVHVVLFTMWYKVVLIFKSVFKTLEHVCELVWKQLSNTELFQVLEFHSPSVKKSHLTFLPCFSQLESNIFVSLIFDKMSFNLFLILNLETLMSYRMTNHFSSSSMIRSSTLSTHQALCSFDNIIWESSRSYFIQWDECVTTLEFPITYQLFTSHFSVHHYIVELKIHNERKDVLLLVSTWQKRWSTITSTCLHRPVMHANGYSCASTCTLLSVCQPVFLSACLSVSLSVCQPVCLSACLSVCLSVCQSVCLSVCLPVCLPVCPSVCLPVSLPVCLPVSLPVCLLACLSACLSARLFACLSVCP